jgi:hypothetical protein
MDPAAAAHWVHTLRTQHNIQRELKGSTLIRRQPTLVTAILHELASRASVLVIDKNYALAGKFFDLVLEPLLRPLMPTLGEHHFHHFVTTALYASLRTSDQTAEQLLHTFEGCVRDYTPDRLIALLSSWPEEAALPGFLRGLQTFCQTHFAHIRQHIVNLEHEPGVGPWILDMSATALYTLLRHWGQDGTPLRVYCDRNKALQAQADLLNLMVYPWPGRTITIDGVSAPTYLMVEPVHFVDSHHEPGIQLADVVASAFAAAYRAGEGSWGDAFLDQHDDLLHPKSTLVDARHIDMALLPAYRNRIIFDELVRRTMLGEDLTADLTPVIAQAHADFPGWCAWLHAQQEA